MTETRANCPDEPLTEGERFGRFVILRDVEGQTHAIAAGSVWAMCATDHGVLLMLPGGRLLHVDRPMIKVLKWLNGEHP